MIHRKTLKVPSHIADEMTRIVNEPDSSVKGGGGYFPSGSNSTDGSVSIALEYSESVVFDDGRFMTIQVCSSENPSQESCWTQGVLYDRPQSDVFGFQIIPEIACTDVGDSFLGEYHLEYEGDEYIVEVAKEDSKVIFKHTITVTVLSEDENIDFENLSEIDEYISGEGIGTFEVTNKKIIVGDAIKQELIDIGNDGTFFDNF